MLTNEGLKKTAIIQKFIYRKRTFVVSHHPLFNKHHIVGGRHKYSVSDYLSGMNVSDGNTKKYVIRKAKKKILKNKTFDYTKLRQGNSDEFVDGYFTTMESLNQRGNRAEGIKFAIEVFNNK